MLFWTTSGWNFDLIFGIVVDERTIRQGHKDRKHFKILVRSETAGMAPDMQFKMS